MNVRLSWGPLLALVLVTPALSQSADPMRPPPSHPSAAPATGSLGAAIRDAQSGALDVAELVNVLRIGGSKIAAVMEGRSAADIEAAKRVTSGTLTPEGIVIRSDAGRRVLSPNPLVTKSPRPVGSPAEAARPRSPDPRRSP